jgi:signal transduction histidine kinase
MFGCLVFGLLLLRWLPLAVQERDTAQQGQKIAEEAARLKDEFTATVSHELRTPLTAIAASLALLDESEELKASEETAELIAIAHANAWRLRHLVDDILDIEKLEAGKMVFRSQRIDLGRLLQAELATNRPLADRSDVRLRLDAPPGYDLQTDPDRLKQVISNLLSNAIKFSPPGQEVSLSAESRGNKVRISVSDRGPGVPQQFRSRIFQKFAQADMSDARQKTGSGLGLSIVKEIVERLGGSVDFVDGPSGGTIFFVDLPSLQASFGGTAAAMAKEAA